MKAVFLAGAKTDLEDLRCYVTAHFGVRTWRNTLQAIRKTVRNTLAFPQRGAIPDELRITGLTHYRQVLAGKNRIIYEVRGDVLYIHIICDARQDLRSLLARRLLRA